MPSPRIASPELQKEMDLCREKINKTLNRLIPESDAAEAPLFNAMRYGVLEGGKRLRPFLVMQSAKIFGVDEVRACRVGAAIEMVHSYSLIHDDLPAMDDADTRRGKPSVHKAFDEATAILAGDALLTQAFEVLSDSETHEDPRVRMDLVKLLASASGPHGMVAGQMLDLIAENEEFDIGTISHLQRLKTGKLISFCCEAGAILGKANPAHRQALRNYAQDLGLAFQVTDDLLDVEGDAEEMGKATGQDAEAGKATFATELGLDAARARAEMLSAQAKRHLKTFDHGRGNMLRDVADYVLARRK